jgi:GH3 auxin-responsive promoter
MGIKATIARRAASMIVPRIYRLHAQGVASQDSLFKYLIARGRRTRFGGEHDYKGIKNYRDYTVAVPVREYEGIKHYIEMLANGREDALWPGRPLYFCKSSGTTSGIKYIPLTAESLSAQIRAARNALLMYVYETGHAEFFDHKMIFLQGSPQLETYDKIKTGRLSGIVYNHVPAYLQQNRMPSYTTNCIADWEQKVDAIVSETLPARMSLLSGIPPWVVMYMERLIAQSGKKNILEIFPDLSVLVYGGVNYQPYKAKITQLLGGQVAGIETYPASEGFIAYQDSQSAEGLLLNLNGGIFYEFIRADEINQTGAKRIMLGDVVIGVNYALVLTTTAGLWAYSIGDTVRFVSLSPYRIVVTGRTAHYISAFGEHVIADEVEGAMQQAMSEIGASLAEYTVAPQINTTDPAPYHEWLVEWSTLPSDIAALATRLDDLMQQRNIYYRDLRAGNILQCLKITSLPTGAFIRYMKSQGKLGGQNKVPRLANDRLIADALLGT